MSSSMSKRSNLIHYYSDLNSFKLIQIKKKFSYLHSLLKATFVILVDSILWSSFTVFLDIN